MRLQMFWPPEKSALDPALQVSEKDHAGTRKKADLSGPLRIKTKSRFCFYGGY